MSKKKQDGDPVKENVIAGLKNETIVSEKNRKAIGTKDDMSIGKVSEKSKCNEENSLNIELNTEKTDKLNEITIPTDARTIWAVQRFFLFSLILTVFKVSISFMTPIYSINAIAIDAILDLLVSGLGVYLIQWQQKLIEKMKKGDQMIEVNKKGAIGIACIQGIILFIGGLVIFFQSLFGLGSILEDNEKFASESVSIFLLLFLSGIITLKYGLYEIHKKDCISCENKEGKVALKSLETNLLIDLVINLSAWLILIVTQYWYWPFIVFDPVIALIVGIIMIFSGIKYLIPFLKLLNNYMSTINIEYDSNESDESS